MGEHDELIPDFINESIDMLDTFDDELLALEQDPSNAELLNSIFRSIHSIKGMCGFLHFSTLESLSHAGEDLLVALRDERLLFEGSVADLLLQLSDAIRTELASLQRVGAESSQKHEQLIKTLGEMCAQQQTIRTRPRTPGPKTSPTQPAAPALDYDPKTTLSETSLRVDINLLDHLMNLAGELVLARNQILQTTKLIEDPSFRAIVQRLNSVTSELQEGVMKTRVQPIASLWDKLPRIVRDIAHNAGKNVRMQVTGEQTEVDKAILEAIKDPLVHLLRNAIDHGIEAPEVRENLGKHRDGQLSLRAFPDGGYVIIELRDDGGGLNTEKIKQQAIAQGLVSAKQAETMTDSQIHRYIFAPGFSTAETITNLSGRGVGMDVVRSNIESISGQVQIASQANKGTTIRLKIPLSLSIIPTLLVSVNSEMFAIPEAVVTELVKITDEQLSSSVVHAGEASFVRLRNELLPLLSLRDYLGLDHSTATNGDFICIVLSVEGSRFGVAVDHVHNIEEIVVKSLDRQLQALLLYTGATILGDGRIVLILDPSSMLHHLHLHRPESIAQDASLGFEQSTSPSFGTDSFLVVETDATAHAAIPLGNVRRLEKLPPECIERIGDTPMIQYRGHILPIVSLAHNAPTELSKDAELSVVVLADTAGRELGLHVRGIVDICASLQSPTTTLHSTDAMQVGILDSHASLLLDVPELFRRIYGAQTEVQS